MRRFRIVLVLALLALVLGVGFGLVYLLRSFGFVSSGPRTYSSATVLRQVQTLSQWVTVQYVMEKVVIRTVPAENPIGRAVGSENRVLLLAHGVVKAGVDLSALEAKDLRMNGKKITIRLPPAQITDAYLDEWQTKVIDRTTGLFTSFDKDLEQAARQEAVDAMRRSAKSSGILKDADERARAPLRVLFLQMGFEEVEFEPR